MTYKVFKFVQRCLNCVQRCTNLEFSLHLIAASQESFQATQNHLAPGAAKGEENV